MRMRPDPVTLTQMLAHVARAVRCTLNLDSVELDTPMVDLGIDSFSVVHFVEQLSQQTRLEISPSIIFQHPTVQAIASYLSHVSINGHAQRPVASKYNGVDSPTLTIGPMAQHWPGSCGCALRANALLQGCGDSIGVVPLQRWAIEEVVDMHTLSNSQIKCVQHGGFVNAEHFDSAFFSVSPAEASWMDPHQRLLLELGYLSLHGIVRYCHSCPCVCLELTWVFDISATAGFYEKSTAR